MWSLYVPPANFFLLKQDARFCEGCAGKMKGSLSYTKQVSGILTSTNDSTGDCTNVY